MHLQNKGKCKYCTFIPLFSCYGECVVKYLNNEEAMIYVG
jgi:hypothetical protein